MSSVSIQHVIWRGTVIEINIFRLISLFEYWGFENWSIKGFDFCYKHFKSYTNAGKLESDKRVPQLSTEADAAGESSQNLNGLTTGNILSEQDFLYKDLLKKEKYQTNGSF